MSDVQNLSSILDKNGRRINFSYTEESSDLSGYFNVREVCYNEIENIPTGFYCGRDDYDQTSNIIVVKDQSTIVGGARIITSSPKNRISLTFEEGDFVLKRIFPFASLERMTYCEYSRLVLLHEYRKEEILMELVRMMNSKAMSLGCRLLFTISPLIQARLYKIIQHHFGFPFVTYKEIKVPEKPSEYGTIKMFLSVSQLSSN